MANAACGELSDVLMFPTRYLVLFSAVVLALLIVLKRGATDKPMATPAAPPTATPASATSFVTSDESPEKVLEPQLATTAPSALSLDQKNRATILHCVEHTTLERLGLTKAKSLDELAENLSGELESSSLNINVRRPSGKEERLLVQLHDVSTPDAYLIENQDARVFDVDSEGLPIKKSFPENLKTDSLTHLTKAFVAGDSLIFTQRKTKVKLEGATAVFTKTNGHLSDIQFIFNGKTLGCAREHDKVSCACL